MGGATTIVTEYNPGARGGAACASSGRASAGCSLGRVSDGGADIQYTWRTPRYMIASVRQIYDRITNSTATTVY